MKSYIKLFFVLWLALFTQSLSAQHTQFVQRAGYKAAEALDSMAIRIAQIYHNKKEVPCSFCNDFNKILNHYPQNAIKGHNFNYVINNINTVKKMCETKVGISIDSVLVTTFDNYVRNEKIFEGIIEYKDIEGIIQKYTNPELKASNGIDTSQVINPSTKEISDLRLKMKKLEEEVVKKGNVISKLWQAIGAVISLIVAALFWFLFKRYNSNKGSEIDRLPGTQHTSPEGNKLASISERSRNILGDDLLKRMQTTLVQTPPSAISITVQDWLIASGSAIGKGHLTTGICQDSFGVGKIGELWQYMVVCDGAGSAMFSDKGAQFITGRAVPALLQPKLLEWEKQKIMPGSEEWRITALDIFKKIKEGLAVMANENKKPLKDFASTVILVAYNSEGLLCAHIGDGRAAYRKTDKTWEPIMVPFKGKEANSTVFITSDWIDDLIETRVINDKISAITAMSDGCEQHAFECSQLDMLDNKWHDPNRPFPGFFEPVLSKLSELKGNGANISDINNTWKAYLEKGTHSLQNETDDKTMVIALNLSLYYPT